MKPLTSISFLPHALSPAPQAVDELDDVDWPQPLAKKDGGWNPAPLEWLFGGFLLCMAIAALPLLGIRWTMPEAMRLGAALADTVVFALPVVVPLPFLFFGCAAALILQPRSRTPAAFAAFATALTIGLAAVHALLG
ncbi:hypothetical protein [Variovorax sp. JS1663]|uniref:hypothetical protein n=1 Tax=Variovorax sp. JS1663 TaxID=1851577 RepID=UPI000B347619|nr:hypothetical protein [Variovorax sp. JS1663]OUM03109.1 hypothetical protein A8M77_07400 [Variovorax sp. JS1663]